tara:strand:- start:1249 stop:1482 length:234 start_codon:yes stop_codon:yes gene_type:complete
MTEDIIASEITPESTMNVEAFAHWGLNEVAYIKQTELNGVLVYAVHAANGDPLATAPARDVAAAFVLQNELTPVDAH